MGNKDMGLSGFKRKLVLTLSTSIFYVFLSVCADAMP